MEVRAKLSVSSDWGNASTDGTGTLLPLNPYFATTFSVGVQSFPDILVCSGASPFSCQPLYPLRTYGTFTVATPNPVANLNLNAGSSVDLLLGTLALSPAIPYGTYTTDIGLFESTTVLNYGPGICACFTMAFPYAAPDIGGTLTINVIGDPELAIRTSTVAGVPELASWAMMVLGFSLVGVRITRRGAVAV